MSRRIFVRHRPGFTLIELLVVISIIAMLVALLLPALATSKAVAQSAKCLSNERQIAIAIHAYVQEQADWWPISTYAFCSGAGHETHDSALWGGVVAYYGNNPYITDFSTNATTYPGVVKWLGFYGVKKPNQGILKCPAETFTNAWGETMANSYGYNGNAWGMGVNQTFNYDYPIWYPGAGYDLAFGRIKSNQVKGPARTILAADLNQPGGYEYMAYQLSGGLGFNGFGQYHPGNSANVLYVDGHARTIQAAAVDLTETDRRR